jgi:hypothetical protein
VLIDADILQSRLLHIGALFKDSQLELQAAQLAIDDINQRSDELFHGRFRLKLLPNISQVGETCRTFRSFVLFCLFVRSSVIPFMLSMHSFTQFFVDLNCFS